jgi:1,4-dihydroxy-2-naphthoyl-CoA synthase
MREDDGDSADGAMDQQAHHARRPDSLLETTMVMASNAGGIVQGSEDAREARRAFMEKRKGQFRG